MIDNKFELTIHARERMEEHFPSIRFRKEVKSVSYCTREEVYRLKQSESYKKIKKGEKFRYNFYKTKNNVYLVCETKKQRSGAFFNIVITVINLSKTDYSMEDYLFNRAAMEASYRLEKAEEKRELEKLLKDINPNKKKKKKKKKKTIEIKKEVPKYIPKSPEDELNKALNKLASKEQYSFYLENDDIDKSKISCVTFELKKLNKSINKVIIVNNALSNYEKTAEEKYQKTAKDHVHAIDKFIQKETPSFQYYKKEGFKEYYLDFVGETLKTRTMLMDLVYNDKNRFSKNSYNKIYDSFIFYLNEIDKNEKINEGLSLLGEKILMHHEWIMEDIYKNHNQTLLRLSIARNIKHINFIRLHCKGLVDKADKLINFFEVIEEMFSKYGVEEFKVKDYI